MSRKREKEKPLKTPKVKPGPPVWWILVILLLAILIRVGVHIETSANDPSYGHLRQDEKTYHGWAESFSNGEMPRDVPFAAPPFYSFILGSFVFNVFGTSPIVAYIFNNILGLLSIYLLFLIGRRVFDTRAGLIAALVYNLYAPFIMLEMKVMVTTFAVTLALLALYIGMQAAQKKTSRAFLGAGLLLGLAIIARPTFGVFIPFYLIWLFRTIKPLKTWAISSAMVIIGCIIPIIPVTVANATAGDDLVILTSTGGLNFYIGNSEDSNGCFIKPEGFRDLTLQHELEDAKRIAESEAGKQLKPSEVSSHFMSKGMNWIKSNPGDWLRLLSWKMRLLFNKFEIGDVWDYYTSLEDSVFYRWLNITYVGVLCLAVFGIATTGASNRNISILGYYLASFVAYQLLFFVCTRFRIPFSAVLCVFIGAGISAVIGKRIERRKIYIGIGVGLIALVVSLMPLSWLQQTRMLGEHYNRGLKYLSGAQYKDARDEFLAEIEKNPQDAKSYAKLAIAELMLDDTESAEQHMRTAISIQPNNEVVQGTYGRYLLDTGQIADAESALRKALGIAPDDLYSAYYLSLLLFGEGKFDAALMLTTPELYTEGDIGQILKLRAMILLEMGRSDEAFEAINRSIELNEENPGSWHVLGTILNRQGKFDASLGVLSKARELDPEYPGLNLAIGDAFYGRGNFEEAREMYLAGLEIEPDSFELYHALALVYGRLGDTGKAKEALLDAIEIKPDYFQAYYNLGMIYLSQANAEDAIASFEEAIGIHPRYYPALLNLGSIYAEFEDYEIARGYWEQVIQIAPRSAEADIARNNIELLDE